MRAACKKYIIQWKQFVWHQCNLAAKEHGLECPCVNNDDLTVLVSGGNRHCWVSMCTVWPSHSKWLSKQNNESASNFMLSFNVPLWKLSGWIRSLQPWATGDWQLYHNNTPSQVSHLVQFFCETSNHPGDSAPLQPRFGALWLLTFPKLKSPLKGKRFQTVNEIQENTMGQLMAIRRTVWGPKVPPLKGTETSLSYVQCFLYLLQQMSLFS